MDWPTKRGYAIGWIGRDKVLRHERYVAGDAREAAKRHRDLCYPINEVRVVASGELVAEELWR